MLGGVAVALLGLIVGVRPAFVCGLLLLSAGFIAAIWARVGVKGLNAQRRLVTRRVVEGELMEAVIELRGRHGRLMGAQVADEFSGALLSVGDRGWVVCRDGHRELRVVTAAPRRGMHTFEPPLAMLRDPFGLARAYARPTGAADQLVVLPRTEEVNWTAAGLRSVGSDREAGRSVFGAGEVDGLRDYHPGTPATRIHWASLARGSGLLERRLISAAESRPTVILDARCQKSDDGLVQLDSAVRAAASLILQLAARGGCTVILPGARMPFTVGHNLQGWSALHAQLALVDPQWYGGPPPTLRPENLRGPLIYVSPGPVPLPAVTRTSSYPVVQVMPLESAPDSGQLLFKVAGCGGYTTRRHARARTAA